jgi:hypothetical protein
LLAVTQTVFSEVNSIVTTWNETALEIWHSYQGRADCENRIKEPKTDLGLGSVIVKNFS